jgi:membrane-bound metal-dependent hydrolase YbcI (DUF457 family)
MFLDIGVGILSAIFVSGYFNIHLSDLLVIGGILFALGPDADFILHFFKSGISREDYQHRNMIHYPLLYLPIGTAIAYLLGGEVWAVLFFIASTLHFLHDSIAIGWGIKWLYPFSNKNYVFLYHYSKVKKKGLRKLVLALDRDSLAQAVEEHWDDDWLRDIYYHWHPIAVVEFGVFLMSLALLYTYVK